MVNVPVGISRRPLYESPRPRTMISSFSHMHDTSGTLSDARYGRRGQSCETSCGTAAKNLEKTVDFVRESGLLLSTARPERELNAEDEGSTCGVSELLLTSRQSLN